MGRFEDSIEPHSLLLESLEEHIGVSNNKSQTDGRPGRSEDVGIAPLPDGGKMTERIADQYLVSFVLRADWIGVQESREVMTDIFQMNSVLIAPAVSSLNDTPRPCVLP